MKRLHDFLDYKKIRIVTKDGRDEEGFTVNVDYAEDNLSGEDEITIENREGLFGFIESEIESIEILDKNEA